MDHSTQFCTFYSNGHFFGVEVSSVQEVIRYHEMTHVPLASSTIGGLINLRGQIVTAFDLRDRMGFPPRGEGELPMNVVLRTEDGPVSLLVDEIGDVLDVGSDQFEPPPTTLSDAAKRLIRGAYKLPDRLLLILATEEVIDVPPLEQDAVPVSHFEQSPLSP